MKKEHWKYLTLSLSIISLVFLAYGFMFSSASGVNVTEYAPIAIESTSYDAVTISLAGPVQTGVSDGIEILQDEWTAALYISRQRPAVGYAQSIVFDGIRHTNGFDMLIARIGEPTEPIVLSIDYQKSIGESYQGQRSTQIYSDDLPKESILYWVGHSFGENPFVEDSLFVTAVSIDDQTDGNYWVWAFSDENPYTGGMMLKINQDLTYGTVDSDWDGTFAIYTEEAAGGGDEPPVISISINTYIQTAGLISLLGAALSSIKYGLVVGWF